MVGRTRWGEDTNMTTETLEDFFKRAYIDFKRGNALIYPTKIGQGPASKWALEKVKQYVAYLKSEEVVI